MLYDPSNWTSNTEWSNFYWANNALGIYKIISDRLLYKVTPDIIELYRSRGYMFSSSDAISGMEKLDSNNLLLDREFSTSIWLVVDNYDNSTSEKLHVILNREKFELTYTDQSDNTEKIEIPFYVEESSEYINLKIELEKTKYLNASNAWDLSGFLFFQGSRLPLRLTFASLRSVISNSQLGLLI
jgi:hypothetical protein